MDYANNSSYVFCIDKFTKIRIINLFGIKIAHSLLFNAFSRFYLRHTDPTASTSPPTLHPPRLRPPPPAAGMVHNLRCLPSLVVHQSLPLTPPTATTHEPTCAVPPTSQLTTTEDLRQLFQQPWTDKELLILSTTPASRGFGTSSQVGTKRQGPAVELREEGVIFTLSVGDCHDFARRAFCKA
jgi:hypothetical protein